MKKVLVGLMVAFALISVLVIAFIWSYEQNVQEQKKPVDMVQQKAGSKNKISLYFTNKDNTKILSETREVIVENEEQLPRIAVDELLKGPNSSEMKRAIPEGTKLLEIKREGTVAIVNFSRHYYNTGGGVNEVIANFSVVNTLCDLQVIQKVKILVEGKELLDSNGQPLGVLGKEDMVINATPEEKNKTTLALYFAGTDSEYLVMEEREIVAKDNDLEQHVIEELVKGPTMNGLSKTVPPETKLLSVETKEGTCFVNLSQEFITKHWGGSSGEIMTIYSIVNSLTELSHIDRVQFLIEGQKQDVFGHMVFNEPFEREENLIKKINGK